MNGVCGVGRDHHVARPDDGEQQVRQRVFGADGDDGFGIGIEFDAVVRAVAAGDLLAQAGNAARCGIAVVARIARGFDQLADDHARRGAIGIAHAQVDDIELRGARRARISLMTAKT